MNNLGYIVAAYIITLGSLGVYGLLLWQRLRLVERQVAALSAGEGERYGRR